MKRKIVLSLIIVLLCLLLASSNVIATVDISALEGTNWGSNVPKGTINSIGGQAIAIAQVIGASIALIMLIVVAIKYMTSSPNERSEIKKYLVPYVFGAFFIFGAIAIIQLVKDFMTQAL